MRLTLPTSHALSELTKHRDDASVSIYLPSSPLPDRTEAVQIAFKDAVAQAEKQLAAAGVSSEDARGVTRQLLELDSDREFWQHQGRAIAVFAGPEMLRTFRIANALESQVAVGDRFDLGPLMRSVSFANSGFVVSVSEGEVKLLELSSDGPPLEVPLDLPAELGSVFERADNQGQSDPPRAEGATGQRIEQQRYCRLVQDAVIAAINGSTLPMILCASRDLEPAYRAINSYQGLLERGIDAHPDSLTSSDIDLRARTILDEHYATELAAWRETFGSRRSNGLATGQLSEVARAATAGAVDELLFDLNSTVEGSIDDSGVVHTADTPGPTSYNIVDEIAVRVLRSGGTVRAVRSDDLPDETPVAATLRFPL